MECCLFPIPSSCFQSSAFDQLYDRTINYIYFFIFLRKHEFTSISKHYCANIVSKCYQYILFWSLKVTCFGGLSNFFPTKMSSCLTEGGVAGSQNLIFSSGDVGRSSHLLVLLPFFFTLIGPRFSKKDLAVETGTCQKY